jgi:integrase
MSSNVAQQSKGIYQMPGSRFFWYRWQENGKRYWVSLKTENFSDAVLAKQKILADVEKRGSEAYRKAKGKPGEPATPVDKIIDTYLAFAQNRNRKPMKPHTAANVRLTLIRFAKESGIADMRQAGEKMPVWIKREKQAGKSTDSLRTYIKLLKSFRSWLIREEMIPASTPELEMIDEAPHRRKNWIEQSKINDLIARAKDDPDLVFALQATANIGMRRGELSQCKVEWFNLERGTVDIQSDEDWTTKNRKARVVPLKREVREFLQEYLKDKSGFVLKPEKLQRGKSRYRYDVSKRVRSHLTNCSANATMHDLRRSFASNLATAGKPLYHVAAWIGDTMAVTERAYAHLAPTISID